MSSTLFTCRAKGAPLPSITWLFNGTAVTGTPLEGQILGLSVSEVVTGSTVVSTLKLRTARSIHNVLITCVASNHPVTRPDLVTTVRNTRSLSVLRECYFPCQLYTTASLPKFCTNRQLNVHGSLMFVTRAQERKLNTAKIKHGTFDMDFTVLSLLRFYRLLKNAVLFQLAPC